MVHFRYYRKKDSHFWLASGRPCTNWGQTEPTSVFHATADLCQISSRSVDF